MDPIRVGILEDDPDQSQLLELWLSEAGYDVSASATGPTFIRAAQAKAFDLMVLDWVLPEMSGFEVLEWVRTHVREQVPVIFLTSKNEEEHVVAALQAGADDYIVKPARREELLARVAAVARRSGLTEQPSERVEMGEFVLDRKLGEVYKHGEKVALTRREFDLAWMLFSNPAKVLSRDYLLQQIWNISAAVSTRTVDTHVSRIRTKLGLRPESGWQLSSVYHYGYRLERLTEK